MSSEIRRFYDFGKFRLDPAEKILFCEDRPVPLRPKVFDMLQMFIENPGHLLQKEELIRAIWQDRFVEESNLTFNIKMLRRALQDDPRAPRFIETVPRRGYRFIAEVTEKSAPVHARENGHADVSVPMVEAKTASAAGVAEKWRGRPAHDDHAQDARATILARPARFYFAMGGLLVVLIAAAVILFRPVRLAASHSAAPILSAPFKSEKFATGGGGSTHAVITPDGEYVAYTSESQGKQSLWLRQLKSGENIQIVPPADTAYVGMTTSHDGKSIYFVRQTPTGSAMFRVGTFGGVPVKLVERLGGLISASPDDKLLSFVRCDYSDDDYCSLFVVNADGTNE